MRCAGAGRARGLLCGPCAAALTPAAPLLPHHIEGQGARDDAWLVDCWGRPHALDDDASIGREGGTLRLLSGAVSRLHAAVARDAGGGFTARDLGSRNGTRLDGAPLGTEPRPLAPGATLHVADVGFVYVAGPLTAADVAPATVRTLTLAAAAGPAPGLGFALHENPMGGGGVLETHDGRTVELPLLQLELVQLLLAEWERGADGAPEVRGWVASAWLTSVLSWDTPSPGPDHLKQLVRRTRAQLAGSGVGVEARRGAGYRLSREG
ncbi:MAG: FHA domain-containing protein [Deltaproteobacteria bacterium]|nr:FHA domain-containing protein [Deltaproteobacteria bacterium]